MAYIKLSSRPLHKLRIAILDDHPIVTHGIAAFLRGCGDFDVLFEAMTIEDFHAALSTQPCDAAVVDFFLPAGAADGVHFLKRLRQHYPELAMITFSAGKIQATEYAAFRAGGNAFVSKSAPFSLLADAIRAAVGAPRRFFAVRGETLQAVIPTDAESALTVAEMEILRHIALGFSVTQVAARLHRSKKTVSTHKRRAMTKLGLADDLALALYLKETDGEHASFDDV